MDLPSFFSTEITSITIILCCLAISAFFSAAETAITSLGTLKVKHLLESSPRRAAPLKLWLHHPGRVISTVLLFNNSVNILASAVTTQMADKYIANGAVSIATGITTFLVLVFGEVIPKSFGKSHAEGTALFCMRIIVVVYFISYPIVRGLSDFADFVIMRLSKGRKKTPLITEEEIEFFVSEGEKAGVIEDLKKEIIEGAFDFDETKVREIMTPRPALTAFSLDTPFHEIVEATIKTGHSRFPVYRENIDQVVGMVLAKDLIRFTTSKQDTTNITAKDVMREALFAPESKTIMEVFKDLKRTKSHMAVIIDEYGGTAGIVTMEDILEEIVGEIQDEFDAEQAKITKIDEHTFDVAGSINIEEFFDYFDYFGIREHELPEDMQNLDVDTLAGLCTQLVGQMPTKGQKVFISQLHLELEVVKVFKRRIDTVRVVTGSQGKTLDGSQPVIASEAKQPSQKH